MSRRFVGRFFTTVHQILLLLGAPGSTDIFLQNTVSRSSKSSLGSSSPPGWRSLRCQLAVGVEIISILTSISKAWINESKLGVERKLSFKLFATKKFLLSTTKLILEKRLALFAMFDGSKSYPVNFVDFFAPHWLQEKNSGFP